MSNTLINRSAPIWKSLNKIARAKFPYKGARNDQLDIITDICYSFAFLNKKHVVYDGPTGSGKSVVAYTVAKVLQDPKVKYSLRARFLTATINLQDQYKRDFTDMAILKSKDRYECPLKCGPYSSPECLAQCDNSIDCQPDLYFGRMEINGDFMKKHKIDPSAGSYFSQMGAYYIKNLKSNKDKDKCPYLVDREKYLAMASMGCTNYHFFCLSGDLQKSGAPLKGYKYERDGESGLMHLLDPSSYILGKDLYPEEEDKSGVAPTYADLIVLDECHKVEEILLNLGVLKFDPSLFKETVDNTIESYNELKKLAGSINPDLFSAFDSAMNMYSGKMLKSIEKVSKTLVSESVNKLKVIPEFEVYQYTSAAAKKIRYINNSLKLSALSRREFYDGKEQSPREFIGSFAIELRKSKLDTKQKAQLKELSSNISKLTQIATSQMSYLDILSAVKLNSVYYLKMVGTTQEIRFCDASAIANPLLFSKGSRFLHMTGSICGYNYYINKLGIYFNDAILIKSKNAIPEKNRELNILQELRLKANDINDETTRCARLIDKIVNDEKIIGNKERAFIFTPSFELAKSIKELSSFNKFIELPKTAKEAYDLLVEAMQNKKPLIVISPSIVEGVDFKDDICRYQIIPKIPFLYMGDDIVKIKQDSDPSYYGRTTLCKLVQVTGRSIRSANDYAKTFILDKRFKWFVGMNRNYAPDWWLKAIRYAK